MIFITILLRYFHDDVIKWKHFSRCWPFCAGNSPVPGEFPAQRPVTRSFDVFFDLRLNKRLSKQSWGWWFETQSCPLLRHCNGCVWYPSDWLIPVCKAFIVIPARTINSQNKLRFNLITILLKYSKDTSQTIARRMCQWTNTEYYR